MTKPKRYYPVALDVSGKLCVVVGGGKVALRKVKHLLESDAVVRVIGEKIIEEFEKYESFNNFSASRREFKKSDLNEAFLAVAATDDKNVNKRIGQIAKERGILVNVVDCAENCDFILPSVMRRGNLTVAVSTDGNMPSLSRVVRETIETEIGKEYEDYSIILSCLRKDIYADKSISAGKRQIIIENLCDGKLLELIKKKSAPCEIDDFIEKVCGKKVTRKK